MFPPGLIDQFRKMQQVPTPGVPSNLPDPTLMSMGNHMMPAGSGGELPIGMAPPQQPLPGGSAPGQALQPFMANGPYAMQALRLAGLLGGGMSPGAPLPVGGAPYTPGRFMPGFRPGIDQPIPRGGGGVRGRGPVQQY